MSLKIKNKIFNSFQRRNWNIFIISGDTAMGNPWRETLYIILIILQILLNNEKPINLNFTVYL